MQVLKMAIHATVEMPMTSLSQLTLKSVKYHALAIMVNSVAARGVFKYMIPDLSVIKMLGISNIQRLQLMVPQHSQQIHQIMMLSRK